MSNSSATNEACDTCEVFGVGPGVDTDVEHVDWLDANDAMEFNDVTDARISCKSDSSHLGSSFLKPSFPQRKYVRIFPLPFTGISPLHTK